MGALFKTKQVNPDQKLIGVAPDRMTSIEQARVLPVFNGVARLGSVPISEMHGVHYVGGGSGKGRSSTGYNVYASFALAHSMGPIDAIYEVLIDGVKVDWMTEARREWFGGTPALTWNVTIGGFILTSVDFHWGVSDPIANGMQTEFDPRHSRYPNVFFSKWKNWNLGINRESLPNIEIVAGRFASPAWFYGPAVEVPSVPHVEEVASGMTDTNPAGALAEAVQSLLSGPGVPDDLMDQDSFVNAGDALASEGLGISPILTRQTTVRDVIQQINEHCDGFLTVTPAGQLRMGLARDGAAVATLDESNLTERPDCEIASWDSTLNKVTVVWTNRVKFEPQMRTHMTGPGDATGDTVIQTPVRAETFQRPWITREAVAAAVTDALGSRLALPLFAGSCLVRRPVGKTILPGDLVNLSWALSGLSNVLVRVTDRTLPAPGADPSVRLRFEMDRAHLNAAGFTPEEDVLTPSSIEYDPHDFQEVIEAPWMPGYDNIPQVWALAARYATYVSSSVLHRQKPSGSYEVVGISGNFALHGEVADIDLLADQGAMVVQLDSFETTLDAPAALVDGFRDECLIVFPSAFIIGNDLRQEVCSVWGAELLAPGKYRLQLIRGRFDTEALWHVIGDPVWIFRKDAMPIAPADNEQDPQRYKLQPVAQGEAVDLGALTAYVLTTTQRWHRPYTPANLAAFGDLTNPTYTTGQDVPLTWSVVSREAAAFFDSWEGGWSEDLPDTVLEFWTTGGSPALVQTITVYNNDGAAQSVASSYLLTNANLVAWFGAQVSFDVKAYHLLNGFRSPRCRTLRVTKI